MLLLVLGIKPNIYAVISAFPSCQVSQGNVDFRARKVSLVSLEKLDHVVLMV